MFGIVWVYNKVIYTPSMIVGPSIILLLSYVGKYLASDLDTFLPTYRQYLAINRYLRDVGLYNSDCLVLYMCITRQSETSHISRTIHRTSIHSNMLVDFL